MNTPTLKSLLNVVESAGLTWYRRGKSLPVWVFFSSAGQLLAEWHPCHPGDSMRWTPLGGWEAGGIGDVGAALAAADEAFAQKWLSAGVPEVAA